MKQIKCLNCGKLTKDRNSLNPNKTKKYCSSKCRAQYNAKLRYSKLKNNPAFKQKQKEYFKRWINKNRKNYNDLQRERSKIYRRKKYLEFKKLGVCVKCGKEKENKDILICNKCKKISQKCYNKK